MKNYPELCILNMFVGEKSFRAGFFVAFGNRAGDGTASSMPRGYAPLPAAPLSFACIPVLAAIFGRCKRGNSKMIFPRLPANLVILGNIQGKSPEISLGYRK